MIQLLNIPAFDGAIKVIIKILLTALAGIMVYLFTGLLTIGPSIIKYSKSGLTNKFMDVIMYAIIGLRRERIVRSKPRILTLHEIEDWTDYDDGWVTGDSDDELLDEVLDSLSDDYTISDDDISESSLELLVEASA